MQEIASDLRAWKKNTSSKQLRKGEFWAVDDVSFELNRGECLGVVGHNGAGKTTLLKMLNGLIKPDQGCIHMRGRVGALIALGAGFDPVLTGRENIYTNGCILGFSRREIEAKIDEIVSFAGVEESIDSPVRNYSSGMQARLGFAVAAHMDPDILLIDEVLAVGDVAFRNKCLRFVEGIREKGGAYILVTHSFNQVLTSCPKALLMHHGRIAAYGDSPNVVETALDLQLISDEKNVGSKIESNVEKDIRILDIKISSLESGGDVVSNGRAIVEMEVEAKRRFENVSWAFYVWNKENMIRLISKHSIDYGHQVVIDSGVTVLRASTGPLALSPKQYSIRGAISHGDETSDLIGYEGDPLWFSVKPKSASKSDVRGYAVDDLIALDVEWLEE